MSAPRAVLARLGGTESGPPALMIHGFGGDRMSWLANAPALFDAYDVWAVELPAHGEAPAEVDNGSIAALATAVTAVADRLLAGGAHLIAHSLGGSVALEIARHQPLRSLTLIAPAALADRIDMAYVDAFCALDDAETALAVLSQLFTRTRLIRPQAAERLVAHLRKPGRREGLKAIGTHLTDNQAVYRAAHGGLGDLPRMTIWGDGDTINPPCPRALAGFGGVQHVIEGSAHMPQVEAAQRVNGLLTAFLAEA